MKRVLLLVAAVPLAYVIFLAVVINWPNPLRRPIGDLQQEYSALFPAGMTREEVESKLAKQGVAWQHWESQRAITATIGSYATSEMMFVVFPITEVVDVRWLFNERRQLESVLVGKYSDVP